MKELKQFGSFLKEAKGEDKYRLLLVSTEFGDKAITAERMEEEAKKLGYDYYITKMEGTYIRKDDDGVWTVHKEDDEKGFIVDPSDTVCFVRGTPERDSYLDLVSQLERAGVCVVNSRECMELASDKYRTYLRLQEYGLTQPKTVLLPKPDIMEKAVDELETEFPICDGTFFIVSTILFTCFFILGIAFFPLYISIIIRETIKTNINILI